jgi:hypothetical protein
LNLTSHKITYAKYLQDQSWAEIENIQNGIKTIAYAGSNRHFQLYDRELQRDVIYVPTSRHHTTKWDKETSLVYHKHDGNFYIWYNNLIEKNVDMLIILHNCLEKRWVKQYSNCFESVGRNQYLLKKCKIIE